MLYVISRRRGRGGPTDGDPHAVALEEPGLVGHIGSHMNNMIDNQTHLPAIIHTHLYYNTIHVFTLTCTVSLEMCENVQSLV